VKDLNGNTIASFTYHPDGLRKTKTVGANTYHYHYDGSNLIRITNDNGQTVWTFTWANGKPNTVTNSNGNTFYYVTNYRGDVMRIVDENGATVASYSYDPWGKVLSVSEDAAVAGQPLGYAGYYYDKETKLYYLQARYYDPETARFISRDPDPGDLDNPVSQNGYTYANNNPVMYVDPNGEWAQIAWSVARTILLTMLQGYIDAIWPDLLKKYISYKFNNKKFLNHIKNNWRYYNKKGINGAIVALYDLRYKYHLSQSDIKKFVKIIYQLGTKVKTYVLAGVLNGEKFSWRDLQVEFLGPIYDLYTTYF
jgi:RHS repeat-associated protein